VRQLTGLDAQFLALESARQYGHVGGLAVLDPSTAPGGRLELEDIQGMIIERLPLLPPFQWKLAEVPLGLDYPYWVDDEDFDIDFHVRELALPSPDDKKLAEQVARIMARPLDRARPLWEAYLIHGLRDGQVALLTKIHHAVVDGVSGAEILSALLDLTPEGREVPSGVRHAISTKPDDFGMLARGLLGVPRYPLRVLQALPRTLPNLPEVPIANALPGAGLVGKAAGLIAQAISPDAVTPGRGTLRAPRTSFNGRISAHRRFAFGQMSLDELKEVKNHYGCTLNDLVVSICAHAVRRWLVEHDELPADPLVAQVPVSVRAENQMGTFGNRILLMSAPLHTQIEDPVERLKATHESLRAMKDTHKALPAQLLQDATQFIPPAVFNRAARLTFALSTGPTRPTWNLVISNVPGPQFPLYCAGAELKAHYPVSVITDGMGLNITVMSYNGHLDWGIVADREQMQDVWCLLDWLREGLDALKPAAAKKPAAKTNSKPAAKTRPKAAPRAKAAPAKPTAAKAKPAKTAAKN
jgi:diacylglycerol O-acyltransferase / wax synthase